MHQNHNKYLTLNVLLWEARECVGRHDDIKIRAFLETALHVLDGHHREPCPKELEPKPFTWQDAERIMLAGGECELSWFGTSWTRASIHNDKRQFLEDDGVTWTDDNAGEDWHEASWRPCSAPAQYTWEHAEAGMRRGEMFEVDPDGSIRVSASVSDNWTSSGYSMQTIVTIEKIETEEK